MKYRLGDKVRMIHEFEGFRAVGEGIISEARERREDMDDLYLVEFNHKEIHSEWFCAESCLVLSFGDRKLTKKVYKII